MQYPTIEEWFSLTEDQAAKWYDDRNVGRDIGDPNYAKPRFCLHFADEAAYDKWWVDFENSDQLECDDLTKNADGSVDAVIVPKI